MKIAYGSDLHLEFRGKLLENPLPIHNTEGADVLVLAGDIVPYMEAGHSPRHPIRQFFDLVTKEFPKVIYIMGNHEHYHGDFDQTKGELKRFLEPYNNVLFLEKEHVVIGDTAFFGATFWTDMKKQIGRAHV